MAVNICIVINLSIKPQQMEDLDLQLDVFVRHYYYYYYCYCLQFLYLNGLFSFSFRFSSPTFSSSASCFWVSSISTSTTHKFSSLGTSQIPTFISFCVSSWCSCYFLVFDFVAVSVTVSHLNLLLFYSGFCFLGTHLSFSLCTCGFFFFGFSVCAINFGQTFDAILLFSISQISYGFIIDFLFLFIFSLFWLILWNILCFLTNLDRLALGFWSLRGLKLGCLVSFLFRYIHIPENEFSCFLSISLEMKCYIPHYICLVIILLFSFFNNGWCHFVGFLLQKTLTPRRCLINDQYDGRRKRLLMQECLGCFSNCSIWKD